MADVFDRLDIHSGTVFNYHQERRKTKNYLADLELLQYDILYGKQYVYDGKLPITEGHMVMGIKDVSLKNVVPHLDGGYSLYGENFTKSSKVYVNGEKQKSSFLKMCIRDRIWTGSPSGEGILPGFGRMPSSMPPIARCLDRCV